jgi:hypothetical protein
MTLNYLSNPLPSMDIEKIYNIKAKHDGKAANGAFKGGITHTNTQFCLLASETDDEEHHCTKMTNHGSSVIDFWDFLCL